MIELIGRYDYGLKYRLYEIVNHLVASNQVAGSGRAAYVHNVNDIRTLRLTAVAGDQPEGENGARYLFQSGSASIRS